MLIESSKMTVFVPQLRIVRLEDNFQFGMFGVLLINSEIYCVTLEPHEYSNHKNVSCIPIGQYECHKTVSFKYGTTYEICNIPDRTNVLFHAGNERDDTEGCILLAEKFGKLRGNRAILNSGATFTKFLDNVGYYKTLHLTITEHW